MRIICILLASTALASCDRAEVEQPSPSPEIATVASLSPLWIAEGFDAPEGVVRLNDGSFIISNVNGEGSDKDGNGYLTHLSTDGRILEKEWVSGLNAPKGMAALDGILYVADIDQVARIDIASGDLLAPIPVPGAQFLNDVTVWQSEIYTSDSRTAQILKLGENGPQLALDGEHLAGVNGVLGDGERLLVSTMTSGSLLSFAKDGQYEEIATGMTDADGIGLVPSGGYLVSSWPGEVYHVADDGTVTSLVNTRTDKVFQNDLSVFGNTVIVPNWMPGTVTAWSVE